MSAQESKPTKAALAAAELGSRLSEVHDSDIDRSSDGRHTHCGSKIWRLRWRDQLAVAVPGDAGDSFVLEAPFALMYVLADLPRFLSKADALDKSTVNVLISRDFPSENSSEVEQAMRSIRDAANIGHSPVELRLWYWGGTDWQRDDQDAPTWPGDCKPAEWSDACTKADAWVETLLIPRLHKEPSDLAVEVVERVGDPSLRIFSSAIKAGHQDKWSLRIDGLEVGVASGNTLKLAVGKPRKTCPGYERRVYLDVFTLKNDSKGVTVKHDGETLKAGELTVDEAALKIKELLARFRKAGSGNWVIRGETRDSPDEGAWEARLLDGRAHLEGRITSLVGADGQVIRGSQFPTLWQHPHRHQQGHKLNSKYLDALLCEGRKPIAVELKALARWELRGYRAAFIQAVLYRHYIKQTPALDRWFAKAGLDRMEVQAVVAFPHPTSGTEAFNDMVKTEFTLLERVGERFGVDVTFVCENQAR